MMQDIKIHKADYSILAAVSAIFIAYFVYSRNNPHDLLIATIVFAVCYFFWGIWHHGNTRTVTKHIVLEYFLVSLTGVVIVCSLLL